MRNWRAGRDTWFRRQIRRGLEGQVDDRNLHRDRAGRRSGQDQWTKWSCPVGSPDVEGIGASDACRRRVRKGFVLHHERCYVDGTCWQERDQRDWLGSRGQGWASRHLGLANRPAGHPSGIGCGLTPSVRRKAHGIALRAGSVRRDLRPVWDSGRRNRPWRSRRDSETPGRDRHVDRTRIRGPRESARFGSWPDRDVLRLDRSIEPPGSCIRGTHETSRSRSWPDRDVMRRVRFEARGPCGSPTAGLPAPRRVDLQVRISGACVRLRIEVAGCVGRARPCRRLVPGLRLNHRTRRECRWPLPLVVGGAGIEGGSGEDFCFARSRRTLCRGGRGGPRQIWSPSPGTFLNRRGIRMGRGRC